MNVRHGSETFLIEGEGLVTTQLGGRTGQAGDPLDEPKAAARPATAAVQPFRFARIGPKGTKLSPTLVKKLARAMTAAGGTAGGVPAGYTYLGQFVDHDLTMDKTAVTLGEDVSPTDMLQGRSPSLDLDSLYGAGPADPVSAKFYAADGIHLKTGDTIALGPDKVKVGHDLPRVGTGGPRAKRTPLIPDLRNDENLIVAQTHLAMIHFHNRVADKLPASVPTAQRFRQARKQVTLHYHWLIRHDFLPRIVDPAVVDDVFAHGRKLVHPHADPATVPSMPVEFSIAAYRLGHSMVREAYNWNRRFPGAQGLLIYMFEFSSTGGDLGGEPRLLSNWLADWRRMYDFPGGGRPGLAAPGNNVNHAMRIDTLLTDPLKDLPPGTFGGPGSIPDGDLRRNLAFRNLTRAGMVRLASGQQMAEKLRSVGVPVTTLTRQQILNGAGGARLDSLTATEKDRLVARTPLWFYVLREAELNGGRLHGVGARIVAETIQRAMEGSRFSLVRTPGFRPTFGRDDHTFEMTDLLFFAFARKKSEINPLGGA